jgi:transposase
MVYDKKYKERVVGYRLEGHTIAETSEIFKVSAYAIKTWTKQYKEKGILEKKKPVRPFKKLDPVNLREYVADHPDAYLQEIADVFGCVESAVRKALKRLKITRKKRSLHTKNKTQ